MSERNIRSATPRAGLAPAPGPPGLLGRAGLATAGQEAANDPFGAG
ncbi:MAG TPA: hypothetical protein VGQ26_27470 [Streptosporangiaceae bacterium]|nr:hypothetical protein [Streptosporangiaceae bacterium]